MTEKAGQRLAAVVFDWAGTVVDFGSLAPMGAFVELFRNWGIELSVAEARVPMGLPKRDHIVALARLPRVDAAWQARHGAPFSESDADRALALFEPMSARAAAERSQLVPGVLETVAELRRRGMKIGTTTGYTRTIMREVIARAAAEGFRPDTVVCCDDVPQGRPTPLGMYRCFLDLAVWPARAVVKIDDTAPGIAEGLAAGCWTVGVTASGNAMGLTRDEFNALEPAERDRRLSAARSSLRRAGAHFVIETVADLVPVLDRIEAELEHGRSVRGEFAAA
ncbi:MAG TPA: phosphonoacetaldehyde hydrolase [Burkholderiales bacterium]|nr:phosphonoacetaldehyde hydrolase [Burkholderiales bacterium]